MTSPPCLSHLTHIQLPNGVRLRLALMTVVNDPFVRRALTRIPMPRFPLSFPAMPPRPLSCVALTCLPHRPPPIHPVSSGCPKSSWCWKGDLRWNGPTRESTPYI
ncbi:hypothetical protein BC834DRAFT_883240 [Gloeopeniophorella convolvens]|nr:hypothetical protein BC834DRAFT_883240 [Gloeopeniophorella convolvens]